MCLIDEVSSTRVAGDFSHSHLKTETDVLSYESSILRINRTDWVQGPTLPSGPLPVSGFANGRSCMRNSYRTSVMVSSYKSLLEGATFVRIYGIKINVKIIN